MKNYSRPCGLNVEQDVIGINSRDPCFGKTNKLSTHIKRNTIIRNYPLKKTKLVWTKVSYSF